MGNFRIVINAAGAHGCMRESGDGDKVWGCGRMSCPDCRTREFLDTLRRDGCLLNDASLIHWPDESLQVVDDLLTRVRKGNFPK